jgi:hypothetical protein
MEVILFDSEVNAFVNGWPYLHAFHCPSWTVDSSVAKSFHELSLWHSSTDPLIKRLISGWPCRKSLVRLLLRL